jgi:urate oxidase
VTQLKSIDYGKSRVRVAKINRHPDRHEFSDLTVAIRLKGPFENCYLTGDNSRVVPTDTMKNTVYVLAAQCGLDPVEDFTLKLGQHFLKTYAHVTDALIEVEEHCWSRLDPYAFEQGQSRRLANVEINQESVTIHAGLDNLVVLKTAKSAFQGFPRDQYTTLKETTDRILATSVRAVWRYATLEVDFNRVMESSRRTLIDVFAKHESRAVQETLYAMGEAVLEAHQEITGIRLTLPNKHYLPVNLEPFGLENRNEVFLPTDEPYGVIEACLSR